MKQQPILRTLPERMLLLLPPIDQNMTSKRYEELRPEHIYLRESCATVAVKLCRSPARRGGTYDR